MSLAMGVVSCQFAFLMCDGFETSVSESGEVRVHDTAKTKISRLPGGDRLIAIGSSECYSLVEELEQGDRMPRESVTERIIAWGNRGGRHSRNYFALISRTGNGLYVWRGICQAEGGWGENIDATDLSTSPTFVVLCDGFLGSERENVQLELLPLQMFQGVDIQEEVSNFAIACKLLDRSFRRLHHAGGEGRIGGEIFYDTFGLTQPAGEISTSTPLKQRIASTGVTRAVDSSGNLLLKNITQANGSTSGPTTTSGTYSTLPEMSITRTTKGNPVLVTFTGEFETTGAVGTIFIQLYRDGSAISFEIFQQSPAVSQAFTMQLDWLDSPSAGSHTYEVKWHGSPAYTSVSFGTTRAMQLVELG